MLGPPADDHHDDEADGGHDHESPTAAGVYETAVDFDRPGFWRVTVTAAVGGVELTGSSAFRVRPDTEVPDAGDPAPRTPTLTVDSDAPAEAIDSRAGPTTPVPDQVLHQVDLVDVLDAGRPAVVVFSTPTYCTSRFCGPITLVEHLERLRPG